jgi:hypothetical protein
LLKEVEGQKPNSARSVFSFGVASASDLEEPAFKSDSLSPVLASHILHVDMSNVLKLSVHDSEGAARVTCHRQVHQFCEARRAARS